MLKNMSWNNCRRSVFVPRCTYTSDLFKVLLTLKVLHGSRSGSKGATLEDVAMHMIRHFGLDGDIKSQVLTSLKHGVKMHFIQKKNDRFSLILPASSIQLAPCKFKNEETERINCIYPPKWYSHCPGTDPCNIHGDQSSCCGRSKHKKKKFSCHMDEESEDPCKLCKQRSNVSVSKKSDHCDLCKQKSSSCKAKTYQEPSCSTCSPCTQSNDTSCSAKRPKKRKHQCARTMASASSKNKKHKQSSGADEYDDYSLMCPPADEDESSDNTYKYEAPKNCKCSCSK